MNNINQSQQVKLYNMKAVAQETGLNPITIRTWEQRYNLPSPLRTEAGHRQYKQRDIDTLKWLVARQKEGVSIRHATEMWQALEAKGTDPLDNADESVQQKPSIQLQNDSNSQIEKLREEWITSCILFDGQSAEQVLAQAFSYLPAEVVCMEILQRGVAQIGEGWVQGEVTIQQEHFATAIAVRRLETLVAAATQPYRAERVLIFCAPGDDHTFIPLLLSFLLSRRGLNVFYLGANIPADALNETVAQIGPDLVIISAQRFHTAANLFDVAQLLQEQDVPIGFGGLVFNHIPTLRQIIPGHFLGESLEIALNRIERLVTTSADLPTPADRVTTDTNTILYSRALQEFKSRRPIMESHVWGSFVANNMPTDDLMQINSDFALTLMAALRLGSVELLGKNSEWIEDLLISYRPSQEFIHEYLTVYGQAAKIHLSESANLIRDWLAKIVASLDVLE
ncbi:MAG: MerR family transcriptional regulator [Chloroflexota bacterium]